MNATVECPRISDTTLGGWPAAKLVESNVPTLRKGEKAREQLLADAMRSDHLIAEIAA